VLEGTLNTAQSNPIHTLPVGLRLPKFLQDLSISTLKPLEPTTKFGTQNIAASVISMVFDSALASLI